MIRVTTISKKCFYLAFIAFTLESRLRKNSPSGSGVSVHIFHRACINGIKTIWLMSFMKQLPLVITLVASTRSALHSDKALWQHDMFNRCFIMSVSRPVPSDNTVPLSALGTNKLLYLTLFFLICCHTSCGIIKIIWTLFARKESTRRLRTQVVDKYNSNVFPPLFTICD